MTLAKKKRNIAIEAALSAIEDACNVSKADTTEMNPDTILFHVSTIRDHVPNEELEVFETEVEVEELAEFINYGPGISMQQFMQLPGSTAKEKATFLLGVFNSFKEAQNITA